MSNAFVMGLLALGGAGLFVWTVADGRTTVGKGMTRRTITRAGEPVSFFFEVLKIGVGTLILAAGAVWMAVRAKTG